MRSIGILAASAICYASHAQVVRYVDDDALPGGDGTSWATAYHNLSDALASRSVEVIHVAAGTYRGSFAMRSGLSIIGGFNGESILSGDINGDDPLLSDNAWHVVRCVDTDSSAILAYFTITGGHADDGSGAGPDAEGGGLYMARSSALIDHVVFDGNRSTSHDTGGAGIFMLDSSPTIVDCQFTDNLPANSRQGAGIYSLNSTPFIHRCLFENNRGFWGNGVYGDGGSISALYCTFMPGAIGVEIGDGLYLSGGTHHLDTCNFIGGTDDVDGGGGIYSHNAFTTVEECTFSGYTAELFAGAAIWSDGAKGGIKVRDSIFADNSCIAWAEGTGSCIHASGGNQAWVTGGLFENNTAPEVAASEGSSIFD